MRFILDESLFEDATTAMKKFEVSFTVDGIRSAETVNAVTLQDAQKIVRKKNDGKTVVFQSTKEVKDNNNGMTEDFEVDDDFDSNFASLNLSSEEAEEEKVELPTQSGNSIAALISPMIEQELSIASMYNSVILSIDNTEISEKLNALAVECNEHVGKLQAILATVSPAAESIKDGMESDAPAKDVEVIGNNMYDMSCDICVDDDF